MREMGYGSCVAAAMLAILGPATARAATDVTHSYYHFPGSNDVGFRFTTSGGILNPGLIVGFNPQPDPPGKPILSVLEDRVIRISQPDDPLNPTGAYDFVFDLPRATGLLLPAVQKPDSDGITNFGFEYDGNVFDVHLAFSGPGSAGSWSWGAFNPQPDPPGAWTGAAITFSGADPAVSISLLENGSPLAVTSVPEPSTWATLLIGFGGIGFIGYRRGAIRLSGAASL